MKLIFVFLLTVFAMNAHAFDWKDLIPIVIGGGGQSPNQPYPGQPYPGGPGGNVTCKATDKGWEEHSGGHYSCGECLRAHDGCVETCSSNSVECRVDGTDNTGRPYSFLGRGYDQWRAQDEAMYNCRSRYLNNCYVVSCQNRQDVVSRRDCR